MGCEGVSYNQVFGLNFNSVSRWNGYGVQARVAPFEIRDLESAD